MKKKNLISLSEFIDTEVGAKGTKKRDNFDAEYEAFKLGVLIQQARQERGLTRAGSRTFRNKYVTTVNP